MASTHVHMIGTVDRLGTNRSYCHLDAYSPLLSTYAFGILLQIEPGVLCKSCVKKAKKELGLDPNRNDYEGMLQTYLLAKVAGEEK